MWYFIFFIFSLRDWRCATEFENWWLWSCCRRSTRSLQERWCWFSWHRREKAEDCRRCQSQQVKDIQTQTVSPSFRAWVNSASSVSRFRSHSISRSEADKACWWWTFLCVHQFILVCGLVANWVRMWKCKWRLRMSVIWWVVWREKGNNGFKCRVSVPGCCVTL